MARRDGINRLNNDEAARELLRPDYRTGMEEPILPFVDPANGEVRGPGMGAGGSNAGEDHDDDHTAGSNTAR